MTRNKTFKTQLFLATITALIYTFVMDGVAFSSTITGTLFHSDGVTPITGNNFEIHSECEEGGGSIRTSSVDASTGTFSAELYSGTCYLRAYAANGFFAGTGANFVAEWWAAPKSVRNRSAAEAIVVGANENIENINFQLDPGAMVGGTIFQSDGITPLTGVSGITHKVYSGTCEELTEYSVYGSGSKSYVDESDGTFLIRGLPDGEYYIEASSNYANYMSEFWQDSSSVRNCSQAQRLTVSEGLTYNNKDFQLEHGGGISGTIFEEDGHTPIPEGEIMIYTGDCNNRTYIKSGWVDQSGKYQINQLASNDYIISIQEPLGIFEPADRVAPEWYSPQFEAYTCSQAEKITITEGLHTLDKNFRLSPGATISGGVYRNDGITPVTMSDSDVIIYVIDVNNCNNPPVNNYYRQFTDNLIRSKYASIYNGTYSIMLGPGNYYLIAVPYNTRSNPNPIDYKAEWWAGQKSTPICSQATPLTVTDLSSNLSDINIQLDLLSDELVLPFSWNIFLPAILKGNGSSD